VGVAYGFAAYLWWGFIALYFKAVAAVTPLEVLCHRVLWSVVLLLSLLALRGRLKSAWHTLRQKRTFQLLLLSTALIAINWYTFIWAIGHEQVLQASLGYFINPLLNVLLGVVFLRESLRTIQKICVLLAAVGVLALTLGQGKVPLVALILALSFGFYGLVRKRVSAGPVEGLCLETLLLSPLAALWLLHLEAQGGLAFGRSSGTISVLLAAGGLVTALPLIWFTNAARRLPYSTVGVLQYLAPSLQFLLAVTAFHEPFGHEKLLGFAFIWTALGLFSYDLSRA
jgi:chloramphenicol-sensitive protein RarD